MQIPSTLYAADQDEPATCVRIRDTVYVANEDEGTYHLGSDDTVNIMTLRWMFQIGHRPVEPPGTTWNPGGVHMDTFCTK